MHTGYEVGKRRREERHEWVRDTEKEKVTETERDKSSREAARDWQLFNVLLYWYDTLFQMPNALVWDASVASAVQRLCNDRSLSLPLSLLVGVTYIWTSLLLCNGRQVRMTTACITGHSTPALIDVGCASVRLRLMHNASDTRGR